MAVSPEPRSWPLLGLPIEVSGPRDWYRHGLLRQLELEFRAEGGVTARSFAVKDKLRSLFTASFLTTDHELLLALWPDHERLAEPCARWSVTVEGQGGAIKVDPPEAGGGRIEVHGLSAKLYSAENAALGSVDRFDPLGFDFRFWQAGRAVAESERLDSRTLRLRSTDREAQHPAPCLDPRLLLAWLLAHVSRGVA